MPSLFLSSPFSKQERRITLALENKQVAVERQGTAPSYITTNYAVHMKRNASLKAKQNSEAAPMCGARSFESRRCQPIIDLLRAACV